MTYPTRTRLATTTAAMAEKVELPVPAQNDATQLERGVRERERERGEGAKGRKRNERGRTLEEVPQAREVGPNGSKSHEKREDDELREDLLVAERPEGRELRSAPAHGTSWASVFRADELLDRTDAAESEEVAILPIPPEDMENGSWLEVDHTSSTKPAFFSCLFVKAGAGEFFSS